MKSPHKNIEILYTDSGNGHWSVAKALQAAIATLDSNCNVCLINNFERKISLLDQLAHLYPATISYARSLYHITYLLTNGFLQTRLLETLISMSAGKQAQEYVKSKRVDLFISCHPLFNLLMPRIVHSHTAAKFISVITDPFTPHAHNFSPYVDLCIVSSEEARIIALNQHIQSQNIQVVGHPTQPNFLAKAFSKNNTLKNLGLNCETTTILVTGGGDGLGKLYETICAFATSDLPIQVIAICGRNKRLYKRVELLNSNVPIRVLGFVNNMPSLLQAVDIIVSKAGPSTVFEAFLAGLPIVFYDAILGQEAGNITYVQNNMAGIFCKSTKEVTDTVKMLVSDKTKNESMSRHSLKLARPYAALDIAKECLGLLNNN